jgi:hypothetical protein
VREILKSEGIRGLYKGFTAELLRSLPANSLTFYLYESLRNSNY